MGKEGEGGQRKNDVIVLKVMIVAMTIWHEQYPIHRTHNLSGLIMITINKACKGLMILLIFLP